MHINANDRNPPVKTGRYNVTAQTMHMQQHRTDRNTNLNTETQLHLTHKHRKFTSTPPDSRNKSGGETERAHERLKVLALEFAAQS